MHHLSQLFENAWDYRDNLFKLPATIIIIEGINDFSFLSHQLHDKFDQKIETYQITQTSLLLFIEIDFIQFQQCQFFFEECHYNVYSIFLKESFIDEFIKTNNPQNSIMHTFDENLYYIFFQTRNISLNFQSIKNIADIKIFSTSPPRYFYGFDTLSELIDAYIVLVKDQLNWPVFALPCSTIYKFNQINLKNHISNEREEIKAKNILMAEKYKQNFPLFQPDKSLFYIGFIEKEIEKSQRIKNAEKKFHIKNIDDVQISHIYQESYYCTIRTFLGFESEFRCLHVFDYFLHFENKTNSIFDVIYVGEKKSFNYNIRYDLYYIEVHRNNKVNFDISAAYSFNYVDFFEFCESAFYGFENEDDFEFAFQFLSSYSKNDKLISLKNVKIVDTNEFFELFDSKIALKMKKSNLFYLIFSIQKGEISELKSILKLAKIIEKNINLNNEKCAVAGFEKIIDRGKAFESLQKLQRSKLIQKFYPEISPKTLKKKKSHKKNITNRQLPTIELHKNEEGEEEEEEQIEDYNQPASIENNKIQIEENKKQANNYQNNIQTEINKQSTNNDNNNIQTQINKQPINNDNNNIQTQINKQPTNNDNNNIQTEIKKEILNQSIKKMNGPDWFSPNQNLIYFYFVEKEKARKISPGNKVKLTLFGIKKCKDIQRYKKIEEEGKESYFSFFGFENYNEADAAINVIKSKWLSEGPIKIYELTNAFKNYQKNPDGIDDIEQELFIKAINEKKQNRIIQQKNEDIQNDITSVKINSYVDIEPDEYGLFYFFDQLSVPTSIQFEIKKALTKGKLVRNIVKDAIPHFLSYVPHTFIFVDFKDQFTESLFRNVFTSHKIPFSDIQYSINDFDFLEFEERIIPSEILESFIHFISTIPKVKEVRRNSFHVKTISTIILFEEDCGSIVLQMIERFLLEKNCLFNYKKFSLRQTIFVDEEVMFKNKNDFEIIVNEIKKFGIKPVSVERNKLILLNRPMANRFLLRKSFIHFKNKEDKMIALNHINSILLKNNKNVVKFKPSLFYMKADPHHYCDKATINSSSLFVKAVNTFPGVVDLQLNSSSIEYPVNLSYIGFKSYDLMYFCNSLLFIRMNYWTIFPNTKYFKPKEDLFYIQYQIKVNAKLNDLLEKGLTPFIVDEQLDCVEFMPEGRVNFDFIGFDSSGKRDIVIFNMGNFALRNPNVLFFKTFELKLSKKADRGLIDLTSENIVSYIDDYPVYVQDD